MAAAAYRAGVVLTDDRTGRVHDYTRRTGVASAEVILPDGATADRAALWNAAESAERRKDSRTAREWLLALPDELDAPQRAALARAFAVELVERYGVAVDVAIHLPDREGDQRNHHAHILTTTRTASLNPETGRVELGGKSAIELGDRDRAKSGIAGRSADDITQLRARWAELANAALEHAGRRERIDPRSLAAQGIDRAPTQHLGPVASDMERQGRGSDRGDANRQTVADNGERQALTAQVIDLKTERHRRVVAAMPAELLVAVWDRLRGELVTQVRQRADGLAGRIEAQASTLREQREQRQAEHARDKPRAPQGLLAALRRQAYERAAVAWTATAERIKAWKQRREADLVQRLRRIAGYLSHRSAAVPDQAMARAERLLAKRAPIEAARLPQARAEVRQQQRETAARERVVDAFKAHATKRAMKAPGYGDSGKTWTAMPGTLRKAIEVYNAGDVASKAKGLAMLRTDDGQQLLASLLPARERERDRAGPSHGR